MRLKRDTSIYSDNIVIENATDSIPYDVNRAYQGYIEGNAISAGAGIIKFPDNMFQ